MGYSEGSMGADIHPFPEGAEDGLMVCMCAHACVHACLSDSRVLFVCIYLFVFVSLVCVCLWFDSLYVYVRVYMSVLVT